MQKIPLRTYIYIDGFNLYYRSLKDTSLKWLDIEALCHQLVGVNADIKAIKYFTARIKAQTNSNGAADRQYCYIEAIKFSNALCEVIEGEYYIRKKKRKLRRSICDKEPSCVQDNIVNTLEPEEKQTDVNIAAHMIEDAWLDRYDQAVLISSDTDMMTALKFVGTNYPNIRENKKVGLICPTDLRLNAKERALKIPKSLAKYADWVKTINKEVVELSQLPDAVADNINKPPAWFYANHNNYIDSET